MNQPLKKTDEPTNGNAMSGRQTYNMVTDTVVGPNVRLKDNLFQGLFILACLIISVGIGGLVWGLPGLIFGLFIGLIGGLFASGIFLMIYRAIQHGQGKHD